jgi:hypothetical protein
MVQNKIDLGALTKEVPSDPKHGKKVKVGRRLPKKLQPAANKDSLLTCDDCKHNCITYEPSREGL